MHTHTMHDNQHHSLYVLNNIFLYFIFFFFLLIFGLLLDFVTLIVPQLDTSNICCACSALDSPDDRDLQCETRDLQSVECTWTAEKTPLNGPKIKQEHHLLEDTVRVEWKAKYVHSAAPLVGEDIF